jgi:hypothetical protein
MPVEVSPAHHPIDRHANEFSRAEYCSPKAHTPGKSATPRLLCSPYSSPVVFLRTRNNTRPRYSVPLVFIRARCPHYSVPVVFLRTRNNTRPRYSVPPVFTRAHGSTAGCYRSRPPTKAVSAFGILRIVLRTRLPRGSVPCEISLRDPIENPVSCPIGAGHLHGPRLPSSSPSPDISTAKACPKAPFPRGGLPIDIPKELPIDIRFNCPAWSRSSR